jgi:hypothetical protein
MNVDMGGGRRARVPVNYPSNSHRSREPKPEQEKKRPEKVATGVVVQRKKNWVERVAHTIFSDDADTLSSYIVMEVLVPAFRNLLYDTVSQGAERALYGESRRSSGSRTGYTNYTAASGRNPSRPSLSRQARAAHDFDDIVLATRPEADEVLDALREMIELYNQASVADLYDLVGITTDFTDNAWGWTDLRTATVRPIRGGYLLNLPRTRSITS